MSDSEGPIHVIEEIIDEAEKRLMKNMEESLRPVIEEAILEILRKYGRLPVSQVQVEIDNDKPDGPEEGPAPEPSNQNDEEVHDSNRVDEEAGDDSTAKASEEEPSPPSLTGSPDEHVYAIQIPEMESDEVEKEPKAPLGKRMDKAVERRFDRLTAREDRINPRLEKAGHALFLNAPGISQLVKAWNTRQTVLVNNDERPVPIVVVQEKKRTESRRSKKERLKEEKNDQA